jgi:hypothetical protein
MAKSQARKQGLAGGKQAPKVAITLRLGAEQMARLQEIAQAENRSLTNFVETALLREVARRDEAAPVITMRSVAGAPRQIVPEDVVRGPGESDAAFARRRDLLVELWAIPDNG